MGRFRNDMVRNWVKNSVRVILRFELVLNKYQMKAVDRGLLEKKPSNPKEDGKVEGGEKVIGSESYTVSRDLEEIRW